MDQTLSAHEYPLLKVFSSDYEFHIPEYQRPYRWGVDHVLQLLSDLEEALDRGESEPYFLGSLVLVRRSDTSYDVIDGQQRLTTLTILFAVLRELADDEIAAELRELVLEPGKKLAGISAKPRLTLRAQDANFFRKHVQTPGGINSLLEATDAAAANESQRAIRSNAAALYRRLSDWDDDRRNRLGTLLTTKTFLVVVSTGDLSSAYRIFSVMNARGLDLAPTDIFKSKIIGELKERPEYARRWEDAEEALGSELFTDLFRDIRTVVSGERARLELLKEFPTQVLNPYTDDHREAAFVDDLLLPYAKAFEYTVTSVVSGSPQWMSINRSLGRLASIDNKDWRPAALWALVHHPDDVDFLHQFLSRLERLAASFLLRGEYATPRIARYLDVLKQLKAGEGVHATALDLTPEEKGLTVDALNGEIYQMQSRRARFVMLRLDEILARGSGVTYDHGIISLEHVLPQNPAAGSEWRTLFSDEERAFWTHRLGNLLLLNRRKNSQAGNLAFATKKASYFKPDAGIAPFAVTVQVLDHDEWTPEVVEQRQRDNVALLMNEWKLT